MFKVGEIGETTTQMCVTNARRSLNRGESATSSRRGRQTASICRTPLRPAAEIKIFYDLESEHMIHSVTMLSQADFQNQMFSWNNFRDRSTDHPPQAILVLRCCGQKREEGRTKWAAMISRIREAHRRHCSERNGNLTTMILGHKILQIRHLTSVKHIGGKSIGQEQRGEVGVNLNLIMIIEKSYAKI